MLRLDPGDGRIRTTRQFQVWEGGGEYNVARGLRRCFGLRTAVVTAIVDNEVGRLLEDLMLQGGVDMLAREVGAVRRHRPRGPRGAELHRDEASACAPPSAAPTAAYSAASQLKPGDIDWKQLFEEEGVRWFHCGGIFAALSATTADVAIEAMEAAKEAGTIDLLRPELPRLALEVAGRHRPRRRGQPQDRLARRRDDRQRGGLHRGAGLRGPGRGRAHLEARPGELQEDDRRGRSDVSQLQGRGHHAAQRQDRHDQRLGRGPL